MSIMEMLLPDTAGGMLVLLMTVLGGFLLCYLLIQQPPTPESSQEPTQEPPEPPRNFTIEQLHEFDGANDATPAYVALRGEVFDVSSKPEHYKEGGTYNLFSGHDASYSLASGSLNPIDLDKSYGGLNPMERETLDGWVERFKHINGYPVVGKVVAPPKPKDYTLEELRQFDGTTPVPEGSASPPILVGVMGKVYDMSYGGVDMYGPGRSYNLFAGRDASVALAKMSFDPANLDNPDASKLSSQDMQVLEDWDSKFAKKYPVVGKIVTETGAVIERRAGVEGDGDRDGAPEETPGSGGMTSSSHEGPETSTCADRSAGADDEAVIGDKAAPDTVVVVERGTGSGVGPDDKADVDHDVIPDEANAEVRKDDVADAEGAVATDKVLGITNAEVGGEIGQDDEANAIEREAINDTSEVEDARAGDMDAVADANDEGVEKEVSAETEACPDPKNDGESVKIPGNGSADVDLDATARPAATPPVIADETNANAETNADRNEGVEEKLCADDAVGAEKEAGGVDEGAAIISEDGGEATVDATDTATPEGNLAVDEKPCTEDTAGVEKEAAVTDAGSTIIPRDSEVVAAIDGGAEAEKSTNPITAVVPETDTGNNIVADDRE